MSERFVMINLDARTAVGCVASGGPGGTTQCRYLIDTTRGDPPVSTDFKCAAAELFKRQKQMTRERFARLANRRGPFTGPDGAVSCPTGFTDKQEDNLARTTQ